MRKNINRKYFIQEHFFTEQACHGGIGCKDIEEVLRRNNFEPIQFPSHFDFSVKAKLVRIIFLIKTVLFLPSDAVLFFQAPLYAKANQLLVKAILRLRKSIKVVCFITDINGIKDGNKNLLLQEMHFFKKINIFIVHNQEMKNWLMGFHPYAKAVAIDFFDFISDLNYGLRNKKPDIAFAGFLDKSQFVYDLEKLVDINFHLYGEATRKISQRKNVCYYGVYKPSELSSNLEGAFGLVWDGNSIESLSGIFGQYNRFISPHKLSLYVIAGLPLVVHEDAGCANIVHSYKIGFTIKSLYELKEKIDKLSEEEYQDMRKNCFAIAKKLSKGGSLEDVLGKLNLI